MTPEDVDDQVAGLIRRYRLHGTPDTPAEFVNLAPLEDEFPIVIRSMVCWGVQGMVIPPEGRINRNNPATVFLDRGLNARFARLAYAHEIGHALHGHEGAFVLADMDRWFVDRAERQAWEVAAQLLVPPLILDDNATTEAVAAICEVPEWLVDLAVSQ